MRAGKSKSDSRCDLCVVSDLFCNESGFTTLGTALAILLSCSLLFFGLWTSRSLSRAAGVQAVADSCALAAENEVSEFVLAVRAADATLLTLSLIQNRPPGIKEFQPCRLRARNATAHRANP